MNAAADYYYWFQTIFGGQVGSSSSFFLPYYFLFPWIAGSFFFKDGVSEKDYGTKESQILAKTMFEKSI